MAGLRMSVVVSATSFLLGLLFTHWIADSLTLWKSPSTNSDPHLWTAAAYYSILTRVPPMLSYVYVAVAIIGGLTLLWSLGDGRAGNLMFDGGSVLLYSSAVAMYLYSVLPNLLENFSTLPLPFVNADPASLPPFPPALRTPTMELASSHLVCSVAFTGVLLLQAGRWWAEQKDVDDDDDEEEASPDEKTAVTDARKPVTEKEKAS